MPEWIAYLLCAVTLVVLLTLIFGKNELSRFVTVCHLGKIEKELDRLDQVIVVASQVERPDSTLADAVIDNMRDGVSYLFLVSKSKATDELKGYYLVFEALARIAAEDVSKVHELIKIQKLPYDWVDVPYIFYRYKNESQSGYEVLGFKGNKRECGIAPFYERIPSLHAITICAALLEAAPEDIRGKFEVVPNIISKVNNNQGAKDAI